MARVIDRKNRRKKDQDLNKRSNEEPKWGQNIIQDKRKRRGHNPKVKAEKETKINAQGGEPQGTANNVRARMSRRRVAPNVVPARGRSSNHGDVGGTQKEH